MLSEAKHLGCYARPLPRLRGTGRFAQGDRQPLLTTFERLPKLLDHLRERLDCRLGVFPLDIVAAVVCHYLLTM